MNQSEHLNSRETPICCF